jgi:hypothetical protein
MRDAGEIAAEAVGMTIVLAILLTIALVAAGGWEWFASFLASSAANWVQAIGSIAALIAGASAIVWQVGRQAKLAEEARRAEDVRKLHLIAAQLFCCRVTLQHMRDAVRRRQPLDMQVNELTAHVAALGTASRMDLPAWQAILVINTLVVAFSEAKGYFVPGFNHRHADTIDALEGRIHFGEGLIRECLKELGADVPGITWIVDDATLTTASVPRNGCKGGVFVSFGSDELEQA